MVITIRLSFVYVRSVISCWYHVLDWLVGRFQVVARFLQVGRPDGCMSHTPISMMSVCSRFGVFVCHGEINSVDREL